MANRRKMALAVKMKFVSDKDQTILQNKPFVILMATAGRRRYLPERLSFFLDQSRELKVF